MAVFNESAQQHAKLFNLNQLGKIPPLIAIYIKIQSHESNAMPLIIQLNNDLFFSLMTLIIPVIKKPKDIKYDKKINIPMLLSSIDIFIKLNDILRAMIKNNNDKELNTEDFIYILL